LWLTSVKSDIIRHAAADQDISSAHRELANRISTLHQDAPQATDLPALDLDMEIKTSEELEELFIDIPPKVRQQLDEVSHWDLPDHATPESIGLPELSIAFTVHFNRLTFD
jgi:hypothetical protein